MQFLHFNTLVFIILINALYGTCQEDKINDWIRSNNCLPEAPIQLDFCTCQCSDVTAALRSSPELQLEVSRRLAKKKRRSGARQSRSGEDREDDDGESATIQNHTPGVLKCWETCVDSLI